MNALDIDYFMLSIFIVLLSILYLVFIVMYFVLGIYCTVKLTVSNL